MSSVREVTSWQDAYIFCLQPNFQDDLWLFMIFAAIQVSIAGLKLTSFFINRWARGAKVGSGDEDEENVGDDGASGGISIMGVLTLIAGSLILAAYCEDEPDERTFNVFKAGVYLNTFLFAVALIFICGLVVAFVLDIITRRRGRSITFRMFLGGTIVLSIAAAFFGATGIMGLKYVQSECYDEVDLFFKLREVPDAYLKLEKEYAAEYLYGTYNKPTLESLYETKKEDIIGEPFIFVEDNEDITDDPYYVISIVYKETDSRENILDMKLETAKYNHVGTDPEKKISLVTTPSKARCFDTAEGFSEIEGLLTCKIRYTKVPEEYTRYEEATQKIVGRNQCFYEEEDIQCKMGSASFPLCCNQFTADYTSGKDCHCINNPTDASCQFDKNKDCSYDTDTLDLSDKDQKDYFCEKTGSTSGWCRKDSNEKYDWLNECNDAGDEDKTYDCCALIWPLSTRTWIKWGEEQLMDMTPTACQKFSECHTPDDFFGGCCGTHKDCDYCKSTIVDKDNEDAHSVACGYDHCYDISDIHKKRECCSKAETTFKFTFKEDSICEKAIHYDSCDDNRNSLACREVTNDCNSSKDCFPSCCSGLKFDFATNVTIDASVASDCFQLASELIVADHDDDKTKFSLGKYIYHQTGKRTTDPKRPKCSSIGGIIDPDCCNSKYEYDPEDPCFCHGKSHSNQYEKCKTVHHSECLPGSKQYPQCCFDIGNFFGSEHYCTCRLNQYAEDGDKTCSDATISPTSFDFIETCPNPCADGEKALIGNKSFICEKPVFEL